MEKTQFPQKVTYYPSSNPAVMTFGFLSLTIFLAYLLRRFADGSVEPWQERFVCSIFVAVAVFYAVKWMHTAWFTAEGIVFYRFGMEYRRVAWNDVIQTGLAKEYKASKLTLVITPKDCPIYEDAAVTTTYYVEKYRRKLILLDATKSNIDAVAACCGKLSYNARYPQSKPTSYSEM
jgi:hypothetical protein